MTYKMKQKGHPSKGKEMTGRFCGYWIAEHGVSDNKKPQRRICSLHLLVLFCIVFQSH